MDAHLVEMTALAARDAIACGTVRAVDLTAACLQQIARREPEVQAFAHLDAGHAMRQAEAADRRRASSAPLGSLHGLPIALKDIVDTADFPTENGTSFDAGRRPGADAAVVERLREAGAIIIGKTVTTELAVFTPGKTRNPHDPGRTPGGSSSGSAAAVGAGMVPLALGSQTNGSVIRPASFCGVVGFKPSRGLVSRHGLLPQSGTLDHVGTFSRTVADAALLVDALAGHDRRDPQSTATEPPRLLAAATSDAPIDPRLAFVRSPVWEKAEGDLRGGFAKLVETLGGQVDAVELPGLFAEAHGWHWTVNMVEMAANYDRYYRRDKMLLSGRLRAMIEEGQAMRAEDYRHAREGIDRLKVLLDPLFARCDAILTPAAAGEAPVGDATGDPAFNTIWTYCGLPAITLPLLSGSHGMPIGVQLVGRHGDDAKLLRTASWLGDRLDAERRDRTAVTG